MLRCADKSIYVGHTDELETRIAEHHQGIASTYTAARRPLVLIWTEMFPSRDRAFVAERRIKKWSRAKKLALADGDYELLSVLGKKKTWKEHREGRL